MNRGMLTAGALLVTSLAAGTLSDTARTHAPLELGGYHVLAADFHVHSFPFSSSTLTPWDTVIDAQRHGLDVIAMTPHNHIWVGKAGRWFSREFNGPMVLAGEEIHTGPYHLLAIGIEQTIGSNMPAAKAIDEVHRQGGVAIAAHPTKSFWPAYDAEAIRKLDATEVAHPIAWQRDDLGDELRQFYDKAHVTAVGDSDFHGLGPIGLCRTYVFTRNATEQGVLDALRHGQTVVYDRRRVYGNPDLIRLSTHDDRWLELAQAAPAKAGFLGMLSRSTAISGLLCAFLFGFARGRD